MAKIRKAYSKVDKVDHAAAVVFIYLFILEILTKGKMLKTCITVPLLESSNVKNQNIFISEIPFEC